MRRKLKRICLALAAVATIVAAVAVYRVYARFSDYQALTRMGSLERSVRFLPVGSPESESTGIQIKFEDKGKGLLFSDWVSVRIQQSEGEIPATEVAKHLAPDCLREIKLVTGRMYSDPLPMMLRQPDLDAFKQFASVTSLHLGGFTIESLDISAVFRNLTELTIDHCLVLESLRLGIHPGLESLTYYGTGATDPVDLANCLQHANVLRFCKLSLSTPSSDVLHAMSDIGTLEWLSLHGFSVDREWLEGLACRHRLEWLKVSEVSAGNTLASFFSDTKELRVLTIDDGALDNQTLRALCDTAGQLEGLLFRSGNSPAPVELLTIREITALKQLKNLSVLQLPRAAVNDEMLEPLRAALPACRLYIADQ